MPYEINRKLLPEQTVRVLEIGMCDGVDIYHDGEGSSKIKPLIKTDEIKLLHDGPRDPGETLVWHTHMPHNYQIMIVDQGAVRIHYKNNDDERKVTDVEAGEVALLPGGLENKLEIVGEEPAIYYVISLNSQVNRLEHLLGEHLDEYEPSENPVGLHYSNKNDKVLKVNEDALKEQ